MSSVEDTRQRACLCPVDGSEWGVIEKGGLRLALLGFARRCKLGFRFLIKANLLKSGETRQTWHTCIKLFIRSDDVVTRHSV